MEIIWGILSLIVYLYACISAYNSISPIDSSSFALENPVLSSLIPLNHSLYLIVLYGVFLS